MGSLYAGPQGERDPLKEVEDTLFSLCTNVLAEKPVWKPDELQGYVLGFLMENPAIHRALQARSIIETLWGNVPSSPAYQKGIDAAGAYIDGLEDAE